LGENTKEVPLLYSYNDSFNTIQLACVVLLRNSKRVTCKHTNEKLK
jgi:hypothetical protein